MFPAHRTYEVPPLDAVHHVEPVGGAGVVQGRARALATHEHLREAALLLQVGLRPARLHGLPYLRVL